MHYVAGGMLGGVFSATFAGFGAGRTGSAAYTTTVRAVCKNSFAFGLFGAYAYAVDVMDIFETQSKSYNSKRLDRRIYDMIFPPTDE